MARILNANDIFIPEFTETATINGVSAEVISSEVDAETRVSEIGMDTQVDASIIVRVSVAAADEQLVSFRGRSYSISHIAVDSANLTKRIYLISTYGGA